MLKNTRKRRTREDRHAPRPFGSGESRAAEFFTVGWLLTTFTTLVCELGGATALWYAGRNPQLLSISLLADVLIFAAVAMGIFSLGLLAAAWKLRRQKPPSGITVFAVVVGVAPLAMLFWRGLLS